MIMRRILTVLQYNLAIFDLDGTLLDTSSGIVDSIRDTTIYFNRKIPSDDELLKFIGPPIQDSFQCYYGLTKEEAEEMATVFRQIYKDVHLLKAKPYDGIYDLLLALKRNSIHTAVATNKRIDYTKTLLQAYDFLSLFDVMCGSDFDQKKRKKDIIYDAIKSIGSDDLRAVMVGDTFGDYDGARLCGLPFIGVTYGFGFKKKEELLNLNGVNYVASNVNELENYLCEDFK